MGRKHRISRFFLAVVAALLTAPLIKEFPGDGVAAAGSAVNRLLLERAARTCLAGVVYEADQTETDPEAWLLRRVMELIPACVYTEKCLAAGTEVEDGKTYQMILAGQENDENVVDEVGHLVGENKTAQASAAPALPAMDTSVEKLQNYEYLLGNFYTVDSSTMADAELLNAEKLLGKDLKIDRKVNGPKILIYHTHSQETFADSVPGDVNTSIVGIGAYLASLLNDTYQIETLHHQGVYDLIDGKLDRSMAYQLAEPEIAKILQEHPSIQVVIDLHRDGVAEGTHLVTEIGGKQVAQIMFFNGLSRSRANGTISYLPNPYIEDNLAFSLQMQIQAARKYPGFTRHIYLRAYRYNMHLAPRTLLVEAGAQTNTVEEMRNAMELLADTLDSVLTG